MTPTLTALTLGQYFVNRIETHSNLYKTQIAPIAIKPDNAFLWQILFFLVHRSFLRGDTLFYWADTPKSLYFDGRFFVDGDNKSSPILLPSWQADTLLVLCQTYRAYFAGTNTEHWLDNGVFELLFADVANMPKLADSLIKRGEQLNNTVRLSKLILDNLLFLIKITFRFVYFIKKNQPTLPSAYQYLSEHYLVGQVGDLANGLGQVVAEKPLLLGDYDYDHHRFGIWLNRAFLAEYWLAHHLHRLLSGVGQPFEIPSDLQGTPEQKSAISFALQNQFTMITGGPGTGKTFTVAQFVLALLKASLDNPPSLALTAPTGKAAQRMQESLQNTLNRVGANIVLPEATTIHRLIGLGRSGVPYHHATNPILADVIVVDEASMLGIELACQLLSAIKTGAKLILLGDVNQLSAVEAGAVLADLCALPALAMHHQKLTINQRFGADSGVAKLAQFVQTAHLFSKSQDSLMQAWHTVIANDEKLDYQVVTVQPESHYPSLAEGFVEFFKHCVEHDVPDFAIFAQYRILTATHLGVLGDEWLNHFMESQHLAYYENHHPNTNELQKKGEWYHGRPIMIIKNAYELGLFNGDVGICAWQAGQFVVYFENRVAPVPVVLLSGSELLVSAYAMTIHKSQGSEFEKVAICVNDTKNSDMLSRELLYTAITRAKERVVIFGTDRAIVQMMSCPTVRQTGFGLLFERLTFLKN